MTPKDRKGKEMMKGCKYTEEKSKVQRGNKRKCRSERGEVGKRGKSDEEGRG